MSRLISEITRAHIVTAYGDDLAQALRNAAEWAAAHDDDIVAVLDARIDYTREDQGEHPGRERVGLTFAYQGCVATGCCDLPVVVW